MENNYLYYINRKNLCSHEQPDSIYNRAWYYIGVCKQKDEGPITHAIGLEGFTIIPEKNKHILIFEKNRVDIPQNLENYDKLFDSVLANFLEKIERYYPNHLTKGYLFFKFESQKNSFIIKPYIPLDKGKIFHFERLDSFSVDLNEEEFIIINEFSSILKSVIKNVIDPSNLPRETISELKREWDIGTLERKLTCKV